MLQSQWKKFQFFDITLLNSDLSLRKTTSASVSSSSSTSFMTIQESTSILESMKISDITNLKFIECIQDYLYVGVSNGTVYICLHDEVRSKFLAHTHQMLFMTRSKIHPIFVTLGLDRSENIKRGNIKIWDVSAPEYREEILTLPIPDQFIITACSFVVSDDLRCLAVGMRNGQIYLMEGDVLYGTRAMANRIIVPFETKTPITNIFLVPSNRNFYLFATTQSAVGCYVIKNGSEEFRLLEEKDGCSYKCADVNESSKIMIVGMTKLNAVTQFYPELRGPTWSFEGQKVLVKYFKNNVIVVSCSKNQHKVAIYDTNNKIISFLSTYSQVDNVVAHEETLYLITRNTKKELFIYKLVEKDTTEKMAILFEKNMYDIAYNLAKQEDNDERFISEISRLQGDHYYSKSNYSNAISCYKNTIGYLEPSYVILKFLDANKIDFLTNYLEDLHSRSFAHKEHTSLLLSCYIHHKDTERLNDFLSQPEVCDPKIAIEVCCQAKMFDMGLALADRFKMYSIYVKILIEDLKIFGGALEIMKERMAIKGIANAIREYGQTLIRNEKNATRDLLMGLVMQIPSNVGLNTAIPASDKDEPVYNSDTEEWIINHKPKTFTYKQVVDYIICALDNNHDVLEEILLFLTQRIPKVDSFVYHKLFEICLLQRRRSRGAMQLQSLAIKSSSSVLLDPSTYEEKIQNLLESTTSRYDKNYVLMLFQMYDYNEGIIYLSQIVENKQELIYYFMKTDDYKNILSTCKKYEEDSDLWIQALTYFSQRKDEESMECIRQILNSIDHNIIAPPIVLNILSRNDQTRYGVIKDYLKRYMSYLTRETSQFNKGNL